MAPVGYPKPLVRNTKSAPSLVEDPELGATKLYGEVPVQRQPMEMSSDDEQPPLLITGESSSSVSSVHGDSFDGEDIVVVGMGCWYPGSSTLPDFWANVVSCRREFRPFNESRLDVKAIYNAEPKTPDRLYVRRASFIDGFEVDPVANKVSKLAVETSDITHWLSLECAKKAVADAGYTRATLPKDRTAVVLGNTLTGEQSRSNSLRLRFPYVKKVVEKAAGKYGIEGKGLDKLINTMEEYFKAPLANCNEDFLPGCMANTIAGRVCNYFDIHGGGYIVDGACASGLLAVSHAVQSLRNGTNDIVLAGGVDISLDPFEMVGFSNIGACTMSDMRVYDQMGKGFLPGEGCGVVMLKRLSDAQRDGDKIYARVTGCGVSSDGSGSIFAPKAEGQSMAISRALSMAGKDYLDYDMVEGHGTATQVGDPIEVRALSGAYCDVHAADHMPARYTGLTSLKSLIGHTKAASGIGGFIKTALAVNQRVIPAVAGLNRANKVFEEQLSSSLYPVRYGRILDENRTMTAGCSAMGFGGINVHCILESASPPLDELKPALPYRQMLATAQSNEVFGWSGKSWNDVQRAMEDDMKEIETASVSELTDLSKIIMTKFTSDSEVRVSLSADTLSGADDLLGLMRFVIDKMETSPPKEGTIFHTENMNVWIANNVEGQARVGFLFPGQGSQYVNMSYSHYLRRNKSKQLVEDCSNAIGPLPVGHGGAQDMLQHLMFRQTDRAHDENQLKEWAKHLMDTRVAQPAICMASLTQSQFLMDVGVSPAVVGGHSAGEIAAFSVAGYYDARDAVKFAKYRGFSMATKEGEVAGAMVVLMADRDSAQTVCDQVNDGKEYYLTVANVNSSRQVVLSGTVTAVDRALTVATSMGIKARKLNVSNAFHSEMMRKASRKIAKGAHTPKNVSTPAAGPPKTCPVLSSMHGQQVAEDVHLPTYFREQVLNQVDFVKLVESMLERSDLILEVGPGGVLTRLARDTALQLDAKVPVLPTETSEGDSNALCCAIASLMAYGVAIDVDVLFEGRFVREYVPYDSRKWILNPCEGPLRDNQSKASRDAAARIRKKKKSGRVTVADLLVMTISELAGYDEKDIDRDSSPTDYLDSIKFMELLTRVISEIGGTVASLDPAMYWQLTLSEIADKINGDFEVPSQYRAIGAGTNKGGDVADAGIDDGVDTVDESEDENEENDDDDDVVALFGPSWNPDEYLEKIANNTAFLEELQGPAKDYVARLVEVFKKSTPKSRSSHVSMAGKLRDVRNTSSWARPVDGAHYALRFEEARDQYLVDVDGNKYLDMGLDYGVNFYGHQSSFIQEAIAKQMKKGMALGPICPSAEDFVHRMLELSGHDGIYMCNSGTEAVMAMVRLARAATRKPTVVKFGGVYHGWYDATMGDSGSGSGSKDGKATAEYPGIPNMHNLKVLEDFTESALEYITANANSIAVVLYEPVQGLRKGEERSYEEQLVFLSKLRHVTMQHGVLLALDEVMTGLRVHPGGCQSYYGIKADMCAYGKIIGGGMPLGAVTGVESVMKFVEGTTQVPFIDPTFVAGTYSGHPLAMAAGRAVLEKIMTDKDGATQEKCAIAASKMKTEVMKYAEEVGAPLEIVTFRSIFRVTFTSRVYAPLYSAILRLQLLSHGLSVSSAGSRLMFVSACHSDEDIERVTSTLKQCIRDMHQNGLFDLVKTPKEKAAVRNKRRLLSGIVSTPAEGVASSVRLAKYDVQYTRNALLKYLAPSSVVVVHESTQHNPAAGCVAEAIHKVLRSKVKWGGTTPRITTFDQAPFEDLESDIVIAVLPHYHSHEDPYRPDDLKRSVARMHAASQLAAVDGKVIFVTFGGGMFGWDGKVTHYSQCAAVGFNASIALEEAYGIRTMTVDFDPAVLPRSLSDLALHVVRDVARNVVWEWSQPSQLGYDEQFVRRRLVCENENPHNWEPRQSHRRLRRGDVVMFTGGGRGITASIALALSREVGVKCVLVGRSQLDPSKPAGKEVLDTLEQFKSFGGQAVYYRGDVTSRESMKALVENVEKEVGKIEGVVHGAGLNYPESIRKTTVDGALAEIEPKVAGILNVCAVMTERPPKIMVGIGSIIGMIGMPRNAWYSYGNECLSVILRSFERDHSETTSCVTLAYGLWNGAGMGQRTGAANFMAQMGTGSITVEQGCRGFMECVSRESGQSNIILSARMGVWDNTYDWLSLPRPRVLKRLENKWYFDLHLNQEKADDVEDEFNALSGYRFLETILQWREAGEMWVGCNLSLQTDAYLKDHCYNGTFLFPTVFGLEAMTQVAMTFMQLPCDVTSFKYENLQLSRPVVVPPNDEGCRIMIYACLVPTPASKPPMVKCGIRCVSSNFELDHMSVLITWETPSNRHLHGEGELSVEAATLSCARTPSAMRVYEDLLFHGTTFRRLEALSLVHLENGSADTNAIAFQTECRPDGFNSLTAFNTSGTLWTVDPFLFDSLLHVVQVMNPQSVALPVSISSIEIRPASLRACGKSLLSGVARMAEAIGDDSTFDVTAATLDGDSLISLKGYRTHKTESDDLSKPTLLELFSTETPASSTSSSPSVSPHRCTTPVESVGPDDFIHTRREESLPLSSPLAMNPTEAQECRAQTLDVIGTIPAWVQGTLFRNGPAKRNVGGEELVGHFFDGLSMLHAFSISGGNVMYTNKLLRSESYVTSEVEKKITWAGFATDPCQARFRNTASKFDPLPLLCDNVNVNVVRLHKSLLAMGERPLSIMVDPETLDNLGVYVPKQNQGQFGTAHPCFVADGEMLNLYLDVRGPSPLFQLIRSRQMDGNQGSDCLESECLVSWKSDRPSYVHSFSVTDHYAIVVCYPFIVEPNGGYKKSTPFIDNFVWKPELGVRFYVVDLETGDMVTTLDADEAFFSFHHVNAYETSQRGNEIVIDLVQYPDASLVSGLRLSAMAAPSSERHLDGQLTRWIIDLRNNSVSSQVLTHQHIELPQVRSADIGVQYKCCYGVSASGPSSVWYDQLVRVDTNTGNVLKWNQNGCYVGEPVHVTAASDGENDIVMSVVLDPELTRSYLVILDAETMEELGRAVLPNAYFGDLHGTFHAGSLKDNFAI